MRKRLRLSVFAGSVAALGMLLFAAPAMATDPTSSAPDPQTANIPYLAWAGEQVRITKCLGQQEMIDDMKLSADTAKGLLTPGLILRSSWTVEDWSGVDENNAGPRFLNAPNGDTVAYLDDSYRLCFSVHVSSLKPGMAVIKGAARIDFKGETPGFDILGKHQFLVIWMRDAAPVIKEVANADFPSIDVGDPAGDGIFNPLGTAPNKAFKNGLVKINVKGTFPLGNDFAGIDPDNSITLPDDWAFLASKFAVDDYAATGGRPGSAAWRWDIHDNQLPDANHAGGNNCTPRAGAVDAVDNCFPDTGTVGGGQTGPFSHYFGFSSFTTIGPFDQVRDFDTFLGDNSLNADDAPMPALRVDTHIAAGGIGSLEKADKDDIYVRDRTKPDNTPHNLYAPFYRAWIPAAGPDAFHSNRSGVAGTFVSNNFPGFLDSGVYDFYDAYAFKNDDPTRGDRTIVCYDELHQQRPNIAGYDHVAVYTDEHGVAFVSYDPDAGFRWKADANGRCDLSPGTLGTSVITSEAFYPDQPVLWDQASKVSNSITKTVNSLASKVLRCVPKGVNESFCVETITNIYGNPVAGAPVRFSRSPLGSIQPDAVLFGGFDTRGQTLVNDNSPAWIDLKTNALGQAGVLVTESLNICVDVDTENLGTRYTEQNPGVKRFVLVNPTTGGTTACGTTAPPIISGPVGGGGGTSTGAAAPTQVTASVVSLAAAPVAAIQTPASKAAAKAAKAKLVSAQLLVLKGTRFLVLRLSSPNAKAQVKISLVGKNGKVNRVVIRKISTNRFVTVPNLKFTKAVKSVRVAVVA